MNPRGPLKLTETIPMETPVKLTINQDAAFELLCLLHQIKATPNYLTVSQMATVCYLKHELVEALAKLGTREEDIGNI